ncbi:MAG TPA: hypothetical protein VF114_08740 [Candidatus Limnocylindria bacterium]
MKGPMRRAWRQLLRIADDALPVPPDQQAERDWTAESSTREAGRRRLRLRLHLLEKRGRGGYR